MEPNTSFLSETEKLDTLLIVDDAELNRAVLANIFAGDYIVMEAENGQEGLDKILANREHICAVLLDVVMPVMDGMEMLQKMQELDLLEQIPVFIITGETSSAVLRDSYNLGVMDVILKPVVPYVVKRRVNSVIELYRARKRLSGQVTQQQYKLMEQTRQIAELSVGMVEALSMAIEFRSGETGEHVQNIREITCMLLRDTELGKDLTEEQIELISLGAVMHDVGKIAIPDGILNKPGRLNAEEYEAMKTHTTKGSEMLARIPQMRGNAAYGYAWDIALHHHERWDGGGYPEGLKGDEISPWAQAVSIADVYDALVSKRVYKDAYSYDQAVDMIQNGECGQFSPLLLRCFMEEEPKLRALYMRKRGELPPENENPDDSAQ